MSKFTTEVRWICISIHALRVEGDINCTRSKHKFSTFLSTPSGWRATCTINANCPGDDISIHALRVEGDLFLGRCFIKFLISIHALRVEGDRAG